MGGGRARHFSSWKLNDAHNLTILVKGGRHFFKLQEGGGEAKSKLATEVPELVFMLLIAWSLTRKRVGRGKKKSKEPEALEKVTKPPCACTSTSWRCQTCGVPVCVFCSLEAEEGSKRHCKSCF